LNTNKEEKEMSERVLERREKRGRREEAKRNGQ
jgi:hypothetical protein